MSDYIKFLPNSLIKRYYKWKLTIYKKNQSWYHNISEKGQNPSTMVISCCDSRIHVTSIFGSESGEFFIHRNIANLVPPFNPKGDSHGTSAAIEYAVTELKVSNIIILGHSKCGGIHNSYNLFKDKNFLKNSLFIAKWLQFIKPAFEKITNQYKNINQSETINYLEKESIKFSINNLIDFPFVKNSLDKKEIVIHGLWHDIKTGNVESLNPISQKFEKI